MDCDHARSCLTEPGRRAQAPRPDPGRHCAHVGTVAPAGRNVPASTPGASTVHARRWDHHEHDHGRRSIAGDMPTFGVAMGNAHPRCGRHRERGRGTSPRGRCRADPGAVVLNPAGVIHILRGPDHTFEPHLTRAADERCLIGADVHSRLGALPLRRCDHVRECLGAQIRPGCRYCSGLGKALRFRVHNGAASRAGDLRPYPSTVRSSYGHVQLMIDFVTERLTVSRTAHPGRRDSPYGAAR